MSGPELVGEQRAHVAQRQRLLRADERGLEDALGILGVIMNCASPHTAGEARRSFEQAR